MMWRAVRNGTMDSLDFSASSVPGQLPGGDEPWPWGSCAAKGRNFTPSALLMSDNISNDRTPKAYARPPMAARCRAVYGELLMPVTKALEVQAAARLDHYEGVGSTANPRS